MSSILFCCQCCKLPFGTKDELQIHLFQSCMYRFGCLNSNTPVFVEHDAVNQCYLIYYKISNIHESLETIQQQYFPNAIIGVLYRNLSKRFNSSENVEMEQV